MSYETIQAMEIVNNDYQGYKIYMQNVDLHYIKREYF